MEGETVRVGDGVREWVGLRTRIVSGLPKIAIWWQGRTGESW